MSKEKRQPEWKELRRKSKNSFEELPDPEIDIVNGERGRSRNTIKKVRKYEQIKAEREFREFNRRLKRNSRILDNY